MDKNELFERVENDGIKYINLQFTDVFGLLKSVTISIDFLEDSVDSGTWFDGSSIEGFARIQESDLYLKPDINTYAKIPWLDSENGNTARIIADVYAEDGKPFEGDPRYVLKKAMEYAKSKGYMYNVGPEMEFFLLGKDEWGYIAHDNGGYFDLVLDEAYEIRRDIAHALTEFGIQSEAAHHEVAEGQHEIDIRYGNALQIADNVVTLRFVVKEIAKRYGFTATFMPKPFEGKNGSGMHVHQSLFDLQGNNVFFDENRRYMLSETAENFVAGQLKHIREFSAAISPTVNSYKRLVPGYEAPVYITWANKNRSALIRVPRFPKERPKAARVELRSPDPSANPYFAFTSMLYAGMDGVENKMEPPNPTEENIYQLTEDARRSKGIGSLPGSLYEALTEFKNSQLMKKAFGEFAFNQYIVCKMKEWDVYRTKVSSWELDQYLRY